jgi:hypothetical protein
MRQHYSAQLVQQGNRWPEDGFIEAETCRLLKYGIKQVVFRLFFVCTIILWFITTIAGSSYRAKM